jgi:antitoxin HicB
MALHKIRLELELDVESGIYTITSPDVPGLVTEGSTPEEIQRNIQDAIECLMEGWKKYGMEIPEALRAKEDQRTIATEALIAT